MKRTLLLAGAALIAATLAGSPATAAHGGGGGGGGHGGGGGGGGHGGFGGGFGGGGFGGAGLRGGGGFSAGAFRGAGPAGGAMTRGMVGLGRPGFIPGNRFAAGTAGTRFAQAGRGHWVFDRHHHRHFVRGAFFGFAGAYPYWDDYYYSSCWVRELGPYGWVWVNTCDPYSYY